MKWIDSIFEQHIQFETQAQLCSPEKNRTDTTDLTEI